jgi:cysteine desulfurase
MRDRRDRLHQGLAAGLTGLRLNGHPEKRLPNTLSLSFKGVAADRLLAAIGDDIAASAGAACHADTVTISHVLQAMHVPDDWARGTIRFSVGKTTTEEEIERAVAVIVEAVNRLRKT